MGDRDRVVRKGGQKSCLKAVRKSGKKRRPLGGGGVKWEDSCAEEFFRQDLQDLQDLQD